jgi:8-oxo-dGTP diphosphatase
MDGKDYEVLVEQLCWRPSAYGFVVKDGKLLLSKQFDGFDLPGGGVDLGETPEEAVLREIKEETGILAKNPRLLAIATSYFKPVSHELFFQSLMLYYQCDFVGGELSVEGFDEDEKLYADMPEWLGLAELSGVTPASTNDYRQYVKLLSL